MKCTFLTRSHCARNITLDRYYNCLEKVVCIITYDVTVDNVFYERHKYNLCEKHFQRMKDAGFSFEEKPITEQLRNLE